MMDSVAAIVVGILALLTGLVDSSGQENDLFCDTPQYLELGKNGTITCSFPKDFYAVFWYNTTDYVHEYPILYYINSSKAGFGYTSGKYDVHENGSLIIKNVSLEHEHYHIVTCLVSKESRAVVRSVLVGVIVIPEASFPVIDRCGNDTRICFLQVEGKFELNCAIRNARPMVNLTWMGRTAINNGTISSEMSVLLEVPGYTSRAVTVNTLSPSSLLLLLVCKASAPPTMLLENESLILIHNGVSNASTPEAVKRHVERSSMLTLECAGGDVAFLVWKRQLSSNNVFDYLLFTIFDENFTKQYFPEYEIRDDGALLLPQVEVQDEGIYKCIYGGNLTEGVVTYHVSVYVNPFPTNPVISGCHQQTQYCVLEVQRAGTLKCSLLGIRPEVKLEWMVDQEHASKRISLYNQEHIIKQRGFLFDMFLTSEYDASNLPGNRVTIKCKVSEETALFSHLAMRVVLLFPVDVVGTEKTTTTTEHSTIVLHGERRDHWNAPSWIIVLLVAVCLIIVAVALVGYYLGKYIRRSRRQTTPTHQVMEMTSQSLPGNSPQRNAANVRGVNEEQIRLLTGQPPDNVKIQQFIKELKNSYGKLYEAVQPIPYILDKLYCVDKIFVEVGMEFLVLRHAENNRECWEELESYHNILDDTKVEANRRILEGEPGYGKSTITLQFAYDWSTKASRSVLKDVGILIFLRLRQLKGVKSLYRAIKQFLLPKDSTVTEDEIKEMINNCTKLVIILDGYDEYPDQDNETETDIKHIIMDEMFQESKVILTTRTSCLPRKYPPQSKRIKLTGFSEKARDEYIKKAVVGDDDEAAQKIKQSLAENPVLSALCQVPLFFVMFAHMTFDRKDFFTFKSVTSFFRYMVSCFHTHMQNKLTSDEEKAKCKSFENDHHKLDKLAFDGLTGKFQKINWDKDEMCMKVGHEFYEQYKKIGVLVEEEVLEFNDEPGTLGANHVQCQKQVRFYHKLFCEWYAANHLAKKLDVKINRLMINQTLKHVDLYDLQYFYRFACGLNPSATETIIQHLRKDEFSENFAVLCILEKSDGIDEIRDTVREICSNNIRLKRTYSDIMQWSTIQLLELASTNKIPISIVFLDECFKRFDSVTCKIELKTKQSLPALNSVQEFVIRDMGRRITDDEIAGIFKYASLCENLKIIRLHGCILPKSFRRDLHLATLERGDFQVLWHSIGPDFRLDLKSGQWENYYDGTKLSDTDYENVVKDFQRL